MFPFIFLAEEDLECYYLLFLCVHFEVVFMKCREVRVLEIYKSSSFGQLIEIIETAAVTCNLPDEESRGSGHRGEASKPLLHPVTSILLWRPSGGIQGTNPGVLGDSSQLSFEPVVSPVIFRSRYLLHQNVSL